LVSLKACCGVEADGALSALSALSPIHRPPLGGNVQGGNVQDAIGAQVRPLLRGIAAALPPRVTV
jgi:hypothetical protein